MDTQDNIPKQELIEDRVLSAIREGRVSMRPRWRFIFQAVFASLGVIVFVLFGVYLISFIVFSIRSTGISYAPSLGLRGWGIVFMSLPWLLIGLSLLFVVCLEMLIRRYQFAYRRPAMYSLFGLLVIIATSSWCITSLSLHRRVARSARVERLAPFVHTFYRSYGEYQPVGMLRGVVSGVATDTIFLVGRDGPDSMRVLITPETQFFSGTRPGVSTTIVVFGMPSGTAVEATNIGTINE